MAKTKKVLAFLASVIIFFTMTFGFAGCRDNDREITFMVYAAKSSSVVGLTSKKEARHLERAKGSVKLLFELKNGDDEDISISYNDEMYPYIHIRYMTGRDEDTLLSISVPGMDSIYWLCNYESTGGISWAKEPVNLQRGTYYYRFVVDESEEYYNHSCAKLKITVR